MSDFDDVVFIVATSVLFVFSIRGVRTTHRIWRRYNADIRIPRSIILRMLRNVVTYIVACALWLVLLTLISLAGYGPIEWARYVNVVLLVGILGGIPEYVERTLNSIERTPVAETTPIEKEVAVTTETEPTEP